MRLQSMMKTIEDSVFSSLKWLPIVSLLTIVVAFFALASLPGNGNIIKYYTCAPVAQLDRATDF